MRLVRPFAAFLALGTLTATAPSCAADSAPIPVYGDSALSSGDCDRLRAEVPEKVKAFRARFREQTRRYKELFAKGGSTMQAIRLRKRFEIASRLCDFAVREAVRGDVASLASAERAVYDLGEFARLFDDEFVLWRKYPHDGGGAVATLRVFDFVRDFGAVGDGKTPVDAAFGRAMEALAACGGAPTVLKISAGDYLFTEKHLAPEFTCKYSGEFCRDQNVRHAQVVVANLENCVIAGGEPGKVRFRLGNFESQGLRLVNCRNVTVRNVELAYVKCPFLQGTICAVDPKTATCEVAVDAGTLRPDDPAFMAKGASDGWLCASEFSATGDLHRQAAFMFYARKFEALGGNRWRLGFDDSQKYYQHGNLRVGEKLVVPARKNLYHAASMAYCDFCNFENVWVRNSRAAAFSVHRGRQSTFFRCRVFPEEGRVLSANADGCINSSGTCLIGCEIRNQSDDGVNSMSRGEFVNAADGAEALLHPRLGRGVAGELMVAVDPVTGQYRGNLFAKAAPTSVKWRQGGSMRTIFTRPIPRGIQTYDSLGLGLLTREQMGRAAMNLERLKAEPDHIYAPSADGVGTVVSGCDIRNMRGCGVVIQGANALVEDTVFSNIWMAVRLGGLVKYKEGPPPYNVIVRGNRISTVESGIETGYQVQNGGYAKSAPIRGCLVKDNAVANATHEAYGLRNLGFSELTGNRATGSRTKLRAFATEYLNRAGNDFDGEL